MKPSRTATVARTTPKSSKTRSDGHRKSHKDLWKPEPQRARFLLKRLFKALCESRQTPLSYALHSKMESGDLLSLIETKVDPLFYSLNDRRDDFAHDWLVSNVLSKYQDFDLGVDREAAAFRKWQEAEAACARTNDIFRRRWSGESLPFSHSVEEVLHLARSKMAKLLGTIGERELAVIRESCRHGPGADLDLKRSKSTAYDKFRTKGSVTEPCSRVFDWVFGNDPDFRQEFAHDAHWSHASRLTSVPKNALIDRFIEIQARWNTYIQLGIGGLINWRLTRKTHLDVTSQVPNQVSARDAYDDGSATVDLRSASDMNATNFVCDLMSTADPLWTDLLLMTRCHYTSYKGKVYRLEKISGMGNGYTFPLETMVFFCVAWAVCRIEKCDTRSIRVFGDDIIVPRKAYGLLEESLNAFGYQVNSRKSFANGDFFESCGKDYFQGKDVRPFFVKKKIETLYDMYVLHNQIIAYGTDSQGRLSRFWYEFAQKYVVAEIPRSWRYFGPKSLGGVLHSPSDVWLQGAVNGPAGWEYKRIRGLVGRPARKRRFGYRAHLYTKLSADVNCGLWVLDPEEDLDWRVGEVLAPLFDDLILD